MLIDLILRLFGIKIITNNTTTTIDMRQLKQNAPTVAETLIQKLETEYTKNGITVNVIRSTSYGEQEKC